MNNNYYLSLLFLIIGPLYSFEYQKEVHPFKIKLTPFKRSSLRTIPWGNQSPLSAKSIPKKLTKCLSNLSFTYRPGPYSNHLETGTIVINNDLVQDLKEIFKEILQENSFPIESVLPIDQFQWDDQESMRANNTSGFNYRYISGTTKLSAHSLGLAIDLNPRVNPWVNSTRTRVYPDNADLSPEAPGSLLPGSPNHYLVDSFKKRGWTWGGDWKSYKDYQHFEKKLTFPKGQYCKKPW